MWGIFLGFISFCYRWPWHSLTPCTEPLSIYSSTASGVRSVRGCLCRPPSAWLVQIGRLLGWCAPGGPRTIGASARDWQIEHLVTPRGSTTLLTRWLEGQPLPPSPPPPPLSYPGGHAPPRPAPVSGTYRCTCGFEAAVGRGGRSPGPHPRTVDARVSHDSAHGGCLPASQHVRRGGVLMLPATHSGYSSRPEARQGWGLLRRWFNSLALWAPGEGETHLAPPPTPQNPPPPAAGGWTMASTAASTSWRCTLGPTTSSSAPSVWRCSAPRTPSGTSCTSSPCRSSGRTSRAGTPSSWCRTTISSCPPTVSGKEGCGGGGCSRPSSRPRSLDRNPPLPAATTPCHSTSVCVPCTQSSCTRRGKGAGNDMGKGLAGPGLAVSLGPALHTVLCRGADTLPPVQA